MFLGARVGGWTLRPPSDRPFTTVVFRANNAPRHSVTGKECTALGGRRSACLAHIGLTATSIT